MSRRALLLTICCGLIAGLTISVVTLELCLRLLTDPSMPPGFVRVHPTRRYELTPSFVGKTYSAPLVIDSHGVRGDPTRMIDPSALRIAILGDSVTFGIGVAVDETFTAVVERELGKVLQRPVQAFNLGVPSYNTRAEHRYLTEVYERIKPALVVVQYTASNDTGLLDPRDGRTLQNRFALSLFNLVDPYRDLLWSSYAYNFLAVRALRLPALLRGSFSDTASTATAGDKLESQPLIADSLYAESFVGWQQTKAAFSDFALFARCRQVPVVFALFLNNQRIPGRGVPDGLAPLRSKLFTTLQDSGIRHIIDLDESFADYAGREHLLWVREDDNHFSSKAHELAGRHLAKFLYSTFLSAVDSHGAPGTAPLGGMLQQDGMPPPDCNPHSYSDQVPTR